VLHLKFSTRKAHKPDGKKARLDRKMRMKEEASKGLDTLLKRLTRKKRSTRVAALAARKNLNKIRLD
jgi:hypothetical protein